jgi:hypothetical protein
MNVRRPRTAVRSSALPSLAALLASGVVIDGCDSSDAATRQQRLSSHGENAARDLQGSRLGDALKEIGIGLGIIDAPSLGGVATAGAPPVVNPQPDMQPSGAVAPVQPSPPVAPPPTIHTAGGPMRAVPVPPPPPRPAVPVPAPPGGMMMVHPPPPTPPRAPPTRR